jgi:hypothetical protein
MKLAAKLQKALTGRIAKCLLRVVIRVTLTLRRSLPVYPDKQTFLVSVGMSQKCQRTNPLRGSALRAERSQWYRWSDEVSGRR